MSDGATQGIEAAIAEHESLRAQMVAQMQRAHGLATFGVGGGLAILGLLSLQLADAEGRALEYLGVAIGLGVVALAYVGVVGEEIQLACYLRVQGKWVRDQILGLPVPSYGKLPDLSVPPVLAWEELMARRPTGPRWIRATTLLATFELGATALFGAFLFVLALGILADEPAGRSPWTLALAVLDTLTILAMLASIAVLRRLQAGGLFASKDRAD